MQTCTPPSSLVTLHHRLVLQMSKDTGWDYYVGSASGNLVCQDPVLEASLPSPSPSDSQWLSPTESPAIQGGETRAPMK